MGYRLVPPKELGAVKSVQVWVALDKRKTFFPCEGDEALTQVAQ